MLYRILDYAHHLLEQSIAPGETALDGTAGNGHDTVFLSKLVGDKGNVLSFDIQEQAIESTHDRLVEHNIHNVNLIMDDHAHFKKYIDEDAVLGGAIFNLGYLPGSDKTIVTEAASTLEAVHGILERLKKKGLLILVVYHGHEGGQEEKEALLKSLSKLDQKQYNVLRYGFLNQVNTPPFILAIEKK
ncbi:class I SAM-dependent methyltransferase [Pontibacillus sp. ALD_SL1]|uniref:tRNA (mnm(5)s(2)U34)-methyltransferase n=1 Tax=Pontibacillus sp. ALD_SL1 TaxID=2777185 RepID=UPI001A956FF1|nr:class I SAM-dependent methyltransferase [Pontibacillus sp. ALD_SL1]QSS99317.1 class I SAM-dependent methyltransferase [Pontibacillus sp. ALD_SL1]